MIKIVKMCLIALVISVPALGQSGFQVFSKSISDGHENDEVEGIIDAQAPKKRWFPVRDVSNSLYFFTDKVQAKRWSFIERTSVFINPRNQSSSIATELAADYFRWGRLSVGIQLASAAEESINGEQSQAIQEMIGGGGNVIFSGDVPIFSNNTRRIDEDANLIYRFDFVPELGIDLPSLGTFSDTETTAWNISPGIEAMVFNRGGLGIIHVFGTLRVAPVFANQQFYQNIGRELERGFLYGHLTAGVDLNNHVRLSWNYFFGSSFVRNNFNNTFSSSVLP